MNQDDRELAELEAREAKRRERLAAAGEFLLPKMVAVEEIRRSRSDPDGYTIVDAKTMRDRRKQDVTDPDYQDKLLDILGRHAFDLAFTDRYEAIRSAMETDEGREHIAVLFAALMTEADFEAL